MIINKIVNYCYILSNLVKIINLVSVVMVGFRFIMMLKFCVGILCSVIIFKVYGSVFDMMVIKILSGRIF